MIYVWSAMLIGFVVFEAVTVQLVTIWFAVGSLGGLAVALAGGAQWIQWTVFVCVSLVAFLVTRPLVKRFTGRKFEPTNADRCIGKEATVTEDIVCINGAGCVNVSGVIWSAVSADGKDIPKGSTVIIEKIEGAKLLVKEKQAATAGKEIN